MKKYKEEAMKDEEFKCCYELIDLKEKVVSFLEDLLGNTEINDFIYDKHYHLWMLAENLLDGTKEKE